jgi:hypothetical protein
MTLHLALADAGQNGNSQTTLPASREGFENRLKSIQK